MEDYFLRFMEIVDELKSLPQIEVISFSVFPPVSADKVSFVEEMIRASLDDSIKEFYKQSNGLQLKWIHKKNPQYDPQKHVFLNQSFDILNPWEDYWPEDGCVNILPLEEVFFRQEWGDIIWSYDDKDIQIKFNDRDYDLFELMRSIRPFDVFSKDSCMAFHLKQGEGNPKALLAQDHYIDIESSRLTDFNSYLEFILIKRGLINARRDFYNEYNGHNMDMVITPKEYWADVDIPDIRRLYP